MASAAWVPSRSTELWLPLTIWNTMGTSQCPSVGRAMAPPWAPRGPSRHGQSTSQLQFSRYSPSMRHDCAMTFTSDGILCFGLLAPGWKGGHEPPRDQHLTLLVDGGQVAADPLFSGLLVLARHRAPADDVIARPGARQEAHLESPDIGAAHESGHGAAHDAGAEHPHREHGRVPRGLGEGLVVVDGIEVARGPGIADEVGARQLLGPHLGQGVSLLDVFPEARDAWHRIPPLSVLHDLAGLDADLPRAGHHLAALVGEIGLGHAERHGAAPLAGLLVEVDDAAHRGEGVAGQHRLEELVFLLTVQRALEVEGGTDAPAPVVPEAQGLKERDRSPHARRLGPRVLLVEVERVVVLDGPGELADLAPLDAHGHGLALPADVAPVDGHPVPPCEHLGVQLSRTQSP